MASLWRIPHLMFDSVKLGWVIQTLAAVIESALLKLGWVRIERFVTWHEKWIYSHSRGWIPRRIGSPNAASVRTFAESMQPASYWRHTWEHIVYNNPILIKWRDRLHNHNQEILFAAAA